MDTKASIHDMIETVLRSLTLDVLPLIDDPLAAGKLRACIAILTFAEDRVEHEREVFLTDATAMRAVLVAAVRTGGDAAAKATLEQIPERAPDISICQLITEDAAYRMALSALVERFSSHEDVPLRALLRETLAGMQQRQYAMLRRMETLPPI